MLRDILSGVEFNKKNESHIIVNRAFLAEYELVLLRKDFVVMKQGAGDG